MDPATLLADLNVVVSVGKLALSLGVDVAPYFMQVYNIVVKGETLSDDDRAKLIEDEKGLRARLQLPLPADDE